MRFLQIGLGSMGKRRIRCLQRLGYTGITGFDLREDRRKESQSKYGVETVGDIGQVDFDLIDAVIVSTPPDKHDHFIKVAIEHRKPVFVEASVVLGRLESLQKQAARRKVAVFPSCTLKFHPAIRYIYSLKDSGKFGKITNFTYHSGQYLPDWHPYEDVKKFYVSKKATGAAREIVPFELSWIIGLAGFPLKVRAFKGRTMDVGADIDDTYVAAFQFKRNCFGVLNVDVVSRYATRSLILNFEKGQVLWRWDEQKVHVFDAGSRKWCDHEYIQGKSEKGYNKNITEDMYVDELKSFIDAAFKKRKYPSSLEEDIKILKLLESMEHVGK